MELFNAHEVKTRWTLSIFDLNMLEVALSHILATGEDIPDFSHYRDYTEVLLHKIKKKIFNLEVKYEDDLHELMELNDALPEEVDLPE
jgi:hypothetical protein